MNTLCRIYVLTAISVFLVGEELKAQIWGLQDTTVIATGFVLADNGYHPMPGCLNIFPTPTTDFFLDNTLGGTGWGHQYSMVHIREKSENTGILTCEIRPTYVESHSAAWAFIDGMGTNTVVITYGVNAVVYTRVDNSYAAIASDTLDLTVILDVTGAPFGTPVTIYSSWDHFGGIGGPYGNERPPFFNEDPCFTTASLTLDGTELLGGRFNFNNTVITGWNRLQNQGGSRNAFVGVSTQTIVNVRLVQSAQVLDPPFTPPGGLAQPDENNASSHGRIVLSLNSPPFQTPPDSLSNAWVDFTVDIGGDRELSDPTSPGNNVFDPGDIYMWHGPALPAGGADGYIDDAILNGFDMLPAPPDGPPPLTGVPIGNGVFTPNNYFDVDGHDMLNFYLQDLRYGPGRDPIGYFITPCVFTPDYLFISFDDDAAENWSAANSVPINSQSPFTSRTFGEPSPKRDELIGLVLMSIPPASALFTYGFQWEDELHTSLGPFPAPGVEVADDDVDEIDIHDADCNVWYFSVDHEANSVNGLDPGTIYVKVGGGPGGGYLAVIDPVIHLGLNLGVDIDAFEFAFIYDDLPGGTNTEGLALLFSVDDDDPLTPANESSGLDPGMIYYSYLNGISYPFLSVPLGEDIDALASWKTSLYTGYINPQPCLPVTDLVIQWLNNSNVQLTFTAPQTGTYLCYFTTNLNLTTNPPGPGWTLFNTIGAAAGQQVSMTNSHTPSFSNTKKYVVVSQCP